MVKKLFVLFSVVSMALFAVNCTKKQESQDLVSSEQVSGEQEGGENAPFEVQGDTVLVNNQLCAVSGSPMGAETVGKWTSRVVYHGEHKEFEGKTLVFNECCEMCIQKFSQKWDTQADAVLKYHGLVE